MNFFNKRDVLSAARNGDVELLSKLLTKKNVNCKSGSGLTPLHKAAFGGHSAVIPILLNAGAKVDIENENGQTPLHDAAYCGYTAVVTMLLNAGAAIDKPCKIGQTPLHLASRNGHGGVVSLLLKKGAAVDKADKCGFTPLYTAIEDKRHDCAYLLIDAGALLSRLTLKEVPDWVKSYAELGIREVSEPLSAAPSLESTSLLDSKSGTGDDLDHRATVYDNLFAAADCSKDGALQMSEITTLLEASDLTEDVCAHILGLVWDKNSPGKNLMRGEFEIFLGLVAQAQQDVPLSVEAIQEGNIPPILPQFPLLKPKNPQQAKGNSVVVKTVQVEKANKPTLWKASSPSLKKRIAGTQRNSSSTMVTTKEELITVIAQSGGVLPDGNIDVLIENQDWSALVVCLQSSPLSQLPFIASLLQDVLGPIADAMSIAKAVIGVVGALVDMAMNVQANNSKCQKLGRQLCDIEPALNFLQAGLSNKTTKIMGSVVLDVNELAQFKREVQSLVKPLQTVQNVSKEVHATITEWTAKGTRLFGVVRQMLTAKNYSDIFTEHTVDISNSAQGLQLALSAMTFLNLNDAQQKLQSLPDKMMMQSRMTEASSIDQKEFLGQIKAVMARDAEFKQEISAQWSELRTQVQSQFGELQIFLEGEFQKVHSKLDDIHKDLKKSQSSPQLAALSVKFEELVFNQDANGDDFLGQGSFGMVYRCRWGPNKFAVKLLPISKLGALSKEKILQEALKMATVTHKNTVRLRGVCLDQAPYCLVMDMVGPDLHVFINDFWKELSWDRRWCMALELAVGMHDVHDVGIVHGDLRSPNVMVGPSKARWLRVADFGLATTRSESSTSTTSTIRNTNNVWRAPELLLKPGAKFTKESDVWSYGCVLFEIATSEVPWSNVGLDEVKSFYRDEQLLEIPEDVDPQFRALILLCWQFNAKKRPTFSEIIRFIGENSKPTPHIGL